MTNFIVDLSNFTKAPKNMSPIMYPIMSPIMYNPSVLSAACRLENTKSHSNSLQCLSTSTGKELCVV
jgi:hypothetical protein